MDPLVGEIKAFHYDFVPSGWLICNGSQVSVTQYQALYSVICGLYGGYSNTYHIPVVEKKWIHSVKHTIISLF